MTPVSRFVAIALFLLLAALVSLLALTVIRDARVAAPTRTAAAAPVPAAASAAHPEPRAREIAQRLALGLGAGALVLSLTLLLAGTARARPAADSAPAGAGRPELSALARLAASSTAQGEELSRERDVRRRAEEDARLKQQLLDQSLEEKIRLGRDLHDGIIQSLYATGLSIETARALLQSNPAEAERRLGETRDGLNATLRDVRSYLAGLTPESLRRAGLARALESLLGELRAGRDTRFEVQIDDEAAACLSAEQHLEVLQIAREAVSNALRHGGASLATVRMHRGDHEVCLLVQDNGRGFDPAKTPGGGHGVANMRARAERVGATLQLSSQPGAGTRVLLNLPLRPPPVP